MAHPTVSVVVRTLDSVGGIGLQASLFDGGDPTADGSFTGLERMALDDRSWVDYCPGWLRGSDELFARLLATGRFSQRTVRMYERVLPEPRLTAGWSPRLTATADAARAAPAPQDAAADEPDGDGEVPAELVALAAALSGRYDITFDRIWVNLYRDGRDSVAWHGDRNRHTHTNPLVATVSLGARRRFLLRERGGGPTRLSLRPGHGDLVVMGGACQHEWEHTVPKEAGAVGPRMSVTLRHTAHLDDLSRQPREPLPGYPRGG